MEDIYTAVNSIRKIEEIISSTKADNIIFICKTYPFFANQTWIITSFQPSPNQPKTSYTFP